VRGATACTTSTRSNGSRGCVGSRSTAAASVAAIGRHLRAELLDRLDHPAAHVVGTLDLAGTALDRDLPRRRHADVQAMVRIQELGQYRCRRQRRRAPNRWSRTVSAMSLG
jgi:hypothetical protein